MPARSSKPAIVASYAVSMAIFSPRRFFSLKSEVRTRLLSIAAPRAHHAVEQLRELAERRRVTTATSRKVHEIRSNVLVKVGRWRRLATDVGQMCTDRRDVSTGDRPGQGGLRSKAESILKSRSAERF